MGLSPGADQAAMTLEDLDPCKAQLRAGLYLMLKMENNISEVQNTQLLVTKGSVNVVQKRKAVCENGINPTDTKKTISSTDEKAKIFFSL